MSDASQRVVLRLSLDQLRALDAEIVRAGLESMRANWARGNARLT